MRLPARRVALFSFDHAALCEEAHSLDACMVGAIDYVGDVLEVDVGVAADEDYFLGAL